MYVSVIHYGRVPKWRPPMETSEARFQLQCMYVSRSGRKVRLSLSKSEIDLDLFDLAAIDKESLRDKFKSSSPSELLAGLSPVE